MLFGTLVLKAQNDKICQKFGDHGLPGYAYGI